MITIAALQINPVFGDSEANRSKVKKIFPAACELVVLPELFNTGYQFSDKDELQQYAETEEGETISFLQELAATHGSVIVAGMALKKGKEVTNSAVVVNQNGLLARYDKFHLFYHETALFAAGKAPAPVIDLGFARIGVMICFDWIFPEVSRSLALRGADIIAHPANLVLPFCQDAMITRSLENHIFTVTANRIGRESRTAETLQFTGKSQITSWNGNRLVQAGPEAETVISAKMDPYEARNKQINSFNDLFDMRILDPVLIKKVEQAK